MTDAEMSGQEASRLGIEWIAPVGYINDEERHLLIGIWNPALLSPHKDVNGSSVQVAITIESAMTLRAELDAFLAAHGVQIQ